ncbi:MAG TPA: glycosyl hydrolase family 18 protein [Actinocrinis sp.]|jgi:chitinase|uniref:glycosyl hydrolase family 18 protein n=1 Tax=Actinocrinis sp. TaxID=1920516 RepID=UPI002DDD5CCC|nr:glycosyl hydrolase family 18 protein [Actinocrinis sp.]HEV3168736.1 glycosyl hydrolase family 18 protein [Actinocrinis sp.]
MLTKRARATIAGAATGAVALTAAALLATSASAANNNLLTNPGFEAGSTAGWSCDAGTATVTTSPVHSGSYALAATPTGALTAQCTQTVSVQPNSAYTLSGYVDGPYVYIGATGYSSTWTSSTSYSQLTTSFTTGASTTSVQIYVHGWYGQGAYYADDFSLTGPGGSSSPSPTTGSPSPTHSPSASPSPSASASASASPSASPSSSSTGSGGGTGLPKHVLAGYWQNFTNNAKPLTLAAVPKGYNLVDVAFANADSANDGGVTFAVDSGLSSALGGYSDAQFKADIATLHSRGQKVVLSVGGQDGTISVASSSAATAFANSVHSIMTSYGFDGVDIDLENGVTPTYMAQALNSLHSMVGSSLIITLAPQTIDMYQTTSDYFALALDIKSILTISYTQYYNSGTMNGCDGNVYAEGTENFATAQACFQLQNGLSPAQVGLGFPASSSAAGDGGYLSPSTVNAALDCLDSRTNCGSFVPPTSWPGLAGAMAWSINWDASNGYSFVNTVGPHVAAMP